MTWVVFGVTFALLLGLLVWASNKALRSSRGGASTGIGDGLGSFVDIFDPGQARASRDLKDRTTSATSRPRPTATTHHTVST